MKSPNHRLSIAPMMTHTDRHFRYFLRLISRRVMLYTEMVTTGSLVYGHQYQRLDYHESEHPLGLQLGGSEPGDLARCAAIAEDRGYDEINLNVGCPSDRVQNGEFGACLMAQPQRVADGVAAMRARVRLPVSVKTRIGIDNMDDYADLCRFIETVSAGGCNTFIIHARKAWLQGLSPRQNRDVPPLDYARVHRIKQDYPHLAIIINGGIGSLDQAAEQLQYVDGAMIGRAVCNHPYLLADADRMLFGDIRQSPTRREVLNAFIQYAEEQLAQGVSLHRMTRHILGLFQGQAGARAWRRHLSERAGRDDAGLEVLSEASKLVRAA
ncbi:MAG: tRNA dihydrouridine(20/20a) synthase DusA [Gammaproteobacteria bacterium]